jgi:hypothetical protein
MRSLRSGWLVAAASLLLGACSDSTGPAPLATATFESRGSGTYAGSNTGYSYYQDFIGYGRSGALVGIMLADSTYTGGNGGTLRQQLVIGRNQPLEPGTYPAVDSATAQLDAFTSSVVVQTSSNPFADLMVPTLSGTVTVESVTATEIRGSYDLHQRGTDPRNGTAYDQRFSGRFAAAKWQQGNPF